MRQYRYSHFGGALWTKVLLTILVCLSAWGCRQAEFSVLTDDSGVGSLATPAPGPAPVPTPVPTPAPVPVPVNKATESFTSQAAAGKVDILFVDDNSASMDIEQASLGARFANFASAMTGLNWQVGVTTTDCSAGTFGICGDLLPLAGAAGRILTASTPNYATVFRDTIVRPETLNCVARGNCPSGDEEALRAAMSAMDKRTGLNSGFFRNGAALAIVVLTDEDELSVGGAGATKAQDVVNHFTGIFGANKSLRAYAITTLTGDVACLKMQQDQQGGIGAYGSISMDLARITGGVSQSICSPNYASLMSQIGLDVHSTVTDAVALGHTPIAGTVLVKFTPAQSITWTIRGNDVLFSTPIPSGTAIEVSYDYP